MQRKSSNFTQILVCFNYRYGLAAIRHNADLLFGHILQGKFQCSQNKEFLHFKIEFFFQLDRYEKRNLNREHPLSVSYKKSVAKTLFIILIVFVVLRLPFTILVILRDKIIANTNSMVNGSFRTFWYISQYLMFLNAAVNPVIYGYKNDNFRRAYDQTPLCRCRKKAQPVNGTRKVPTVSSLMS